MTEPRIELLPSNQPQYGLNLILCAVGAIYQQMAKRKIDLFYVVFLFCLYSVNVLKKKHI